MSEARAIVAALGLAPHPEGGWFRETWRAPAPAGGRGLATAVLFLLDAGERSQWHRVDADELWLWHAGAPLTLSVAPAEGGPIADHRLGPDVLGGEEVQRLVPEGTWQAAAPRGGWALVSCIVAPAFEFNGFTLAPPDWSPG